MVAKQEKHFDDYSIIMIDNFIKTNLTLWAANIELQEAMCSMLITYMERKNTDVHRGLMKFIQN